MAAWSRFLTAIRESMQRSTRTGSIKYVILHHGATTSDGVMIQMMVSGSRQVSAQVVVKNERRTGVVPETLRAWTSASPFWDGQGLTIECANESTTGWTISAASYESMAILLADWSRRYGFPLRRNGRSSTVFGHRELYTYFGDSYATACPGGMDIDRVVRRANQILSATSAASGAATTIPEEEQMADAGYYVIQAGGSNVWWISHITGKKRFVTSAQWKSAVDSADKNGQSLVLVDISLADLKAIPSA